MSNIFRRSSYVGPMSPVRIQEWTNRQFRALESVLDHLERETLITKTTTGDHADPYEGMRVSNTVDNTYKIYLDGAWRTVASW